MVLRTAPAAPFSAFVGGIQPAECGNTRLLLSVGGHWRIGMWDFHRPGLRAAPPARVETRTFQFGTELKSKCPKSPLRGGGVFSELHAQTISRLLGGSRLSECRNGFADGSSGSEWSSPSRDPPWEARGKRPRFPPFDPPAGRPAGRAPAGRPSPATPAPETHHHLGLFALTVFLLCAHASV